jgi:hypothetical protein
VEAVGLAHDRGISLAEAEQRLGWQSIAPDLAERLDSALGDRFGGVWIDVHDGDRVKVGVTGQVDSTSAAVIQRTATGLGLSEGYDAVPVRRSASRLTQDVTQVGDEIARVNDGAPTGVAAGVRTDLNALQLDVPPGPLTDAQTSLVASLQRQLGDELVMVTAPTTYDAYACVHPNCDPPLRAGVRINSPTFGSCTAGFTAQGRADNKMYLITAGHCAWNDYGNWSANLANGSASVIGPVSVWQFNANGDAAILAINDVAGWMPQGLVDVTAGPETTANDTYTIHNDKLSIVGMRICMTGAGSATSRCGQVTELDFTISYGGPTVHHLGRASVCAHLGDSGAPMYANHHAYGILVAGQDKDNCDILYQGIRGAEDLLNVHILTAAG